MFALWAYALGSVFTVSMISLVGAATLGMGKDRLKKWTLYLVSFSAGALLADVFLHILPEVSGDGYTARFGLYILGGIFAFFTLEKFIWWHHSHSEHREEIHSMVYLAQAGDTLHNFIDGIIIASSYLISIPVGIATTLAVVFHEIPQELGNFSVLVHGGWSVKKALFFNFLSALTAVLGALLVLVFAGTEAAVPAWLTALAASSFIYIAMSDLIPELQKETGLRNTAFLLMAFVLGISAMGLLLLLE